MAYFANGTVGDYYEEKYCYRCVHWSTEPNRGCPVYLLHLDWNYEAVGKNADATKAQALDWLWPRKRNGHNGACGMFHAKQEENRQHTNASGTSAAEAEGNQ